MFYDTFVTFVTVLFTSLIVGQCISWCCVYKCIELYINIYIFIVQVNSLLGFLIYSWVFHIKTHSTIPRFLIIAISLEERTRLCMGILVLRNI